jgi:hypothetical protein
MNYMAWKILESPLKLVDIKFIQFDQSNDCAIHVAWYVGIHMCIYVAKVLVVVIDDGLSMTNDVCYLLASNYESFI